jgi:Asp-tRNA(Asn)/Glu-tRNA(Gln) amidotransferase A subunit family amidase
VEELAYLSATELRALIDRKAVSPTEVTEAALERLDRVEPVLNAFAQITPELALAAARAAESDVMADRSRGLLHGLPISVKDLITVAGVRCAFGSKTMADNVAISDAPCVERLKRHGACIIGKTTTSEFGCKPVGDSPLTGITRNAWDPSKTPGGSSCGAATSTAAGVTPFALGTDGGGSTRIPSSLTGLFGLKPQFGRIPIHPVSATPTLAHIGPMARTVRDVALLLAALAGHDFRDPFSVAGPTPDFIGACDLPVEGMRIAWSPTLGYAAPSVEVLRIVESAVEVFQDLGGVVELVERVFEFDPIELWMAEFYAGVGTRLGRAYRESPELLDPALAELLSRSMVASLPSYYEKVFERFELRDRVRLLFENYDLLLTPTLPVAAFDVGRNIPPHADGRTVVSWPSYTYPFNLTGQPAASIPAGWTSDGLPVGLQIVSRINHEVDIFRAAAAFEAARPWSHRRPKIQDPTRREAQEEKK